MMRSELHLAHSALVNQRPVRLYADAEDQQFAWTDFSDLLRVLDLPRRSDVAAVLPAARPGGFRPAPHSTLAISFFAALDLMNEFAAQEVTEAWRAACLDVLVASTAHLGEFEGCRAMDAARARSIQIETEAMARVSWH